MLNNVVGYWAYIGGTYIGGGAYIQGPYIWRFTVSHYKVALQKSSE
jgi:hypothetical protein